MKMTKGLKMVAVMLLLAVPATAVVGSEFKGTVKAGWIFEDIEGNQGVYQPTYNLYPGGTISFERMSYRFDNGIRLNGNFQNITLNNRNLALGVTKSGLFGVSVTNNQYRRTYSFDGDKFTRRNQTNGQVWVQPVKYIKLFGGYGLTNKQGEIVDLVDPDITRNVNQVDYTHKYYNGGVQFMYDRSYLQFQYQGFDYSDELNDLGDRKTNRVRVTAVTPVPRINNLLLNGGFQHYVHRVENFDDTLSANTVWGGARYAYKYGLSLRYSFIWDRARRTEDLAATDNITHAVYADKVWRGQGGVSVGYRRHMSDDVRYEVNGNGYFFYGWTSLIPHMTIKAGLGTENSEVESGRTLTGDQDLTRYWASARYKFDYGNVRVKFEDKTRKHDDIGSQADFSRIGTDFTLKYGKFGEVYGTYAYLYGKYTNDAGEFKFGEHVLSGDVFTAEYMHLKAGFGGTYVRSRKDLNVESFTVRFTGVFSFMNDHRLEVIYSAHNFDNFDDVSPIYTQYYTSNVVQVNLVREF